MKKKQLALSVMSTALVASMAASAFAAAPKAGVYIGGNVDKYYSFDAMGLNMDKFLDDVINTVPDVLYVSKDGEAKGGNLAELLFVSNPKSHFVDVTDEMFADIDGATGFNAVNEDGTVEAVKRNPDGTIRDDVTPGELKVESVSAINRTTLEVKFTQPVTAVETTNITLSKGKVDTVSLSEDKKSVTIAVQGWAYSDNVDVKVSGVKAGDKTVPDFNTSVKVPAVSDLYTLDINTDDPDNVILADGATKVMLTATLKDKKTGAVANVDGVVKFTATKGGLAQDEVTLENGKASVQLTSAASDSTIISYINVTVIDAPAAKEYEGLTGQFEVTFSPDADNQGPITFVSIVKAESNQADRFFVTFSGPIDAVAYKKAVTGPGAPAGFGLNLNGGKVAIKDVIQKAPNVLEFILDTDSEGSVLPKPASKKINRETTNTTAPNYLQDNETHKLSVPQNIGNLVLQTSTDIQFIVTDAQRPFIYGVTPKDQLEFTVRFSESMAEDLVEGENGEINTKFLLDGKKVRLFAGTAPTSLQIAQAKSKNEIIVTKLEVGNYNALTGADTRKEVYFRVHPEFKLADGNHQIQIANVGDWAGMVDPNNRVSTQTFDFKVTADNSIPVPTIEVQSPEQWLISFNKDVTSVAGKKVEDAFKIYKADDATVPFVYNTDYVITPIDEEGKALTPTLAAGDSVPRADKYLVEFTKDWTFYYQTKDTTVNYFTSTKNPYKVVINHLRSDIHNAMSETTLDVTLRYDGVSPTITSAVDVASLPGKIANGELVTGNGQKVFVKMSEPVQLRNADDSIKSNPLTESQQQAAGQGIPVPTFEFVKGDMTIEGKLIAGSIYEDDKDFVVEPATPLEAGTWTLYIRSISDDVGNTSATVNTKVTVEPTKEEETDTKVAWAAFDQHGTDHDYLYIKFTKEMEPSGAAGVARTTNYVFNGVKLPDGSAGSIEGSTVIRGIKGVTHEWDGVTIEMPKNAFDGVGTDFRSVLNVANNFKAADGETLSGPYEVQLDDTKSDTDFVDNDMVFEAVYYNTEASALLKGASAIEAEATDKNADGKVDKVTIKLDKSATFDGTEKIKVSGKIFKAVAGTGTTVVFEADGVNNELTGTDTANIKITAINGGIIFNTGLVKDKALPVVISTKGAKGSKNLTLTFSEPVFGSGSAADLVKEDFVYKEGQGGTPDNGPIVSVAANRGDITSLVVTVTKELDSLDLGNDGDKVVFADTVKDLEGNSAATPSTGPGTDAAAAQAVDNKIGALPAVAALTLA
ncbi:Ig-like domain-containing protein, partial [uncultured Brevibacillus sp.]|uniref:Ig-like domain-containing protein n=1 Tax=uncultured Brevibacillus sp. TaxID=169970 RepID=UPI0025984A87